MPKTSSRARMEETLEQQPPAPAPRHHHFGLALIALFKLFKGSLLLAAAVGLLACLHADLGGIAEHFITVLRLDPENRTLHWLLRRLALITPGELEAASAVSFGYALLLLTEGVSLWFEKRWGEYLTVIATSSFIPLEIYELLRRMTALKFAVLGVNLAIVWYLVCTLRAGRKVKG